MKNTILNISLWVAISIFLLTILGFSTVQQNEKICSAIAIKIDHSNGNFFVDEEEINQMVYHAIDTVVGRAISEINTERLENKLENHPSIFNVEVFKTISGVLEIEVKQRTPIVRIFSMDGDSYYIDSSGHVLPTSKKYASHIMVANGYLFDNFLDVNQLNLKALSDSTASQLLVDDIFYFARWIEQQPFWKAQIEQLYVNKESDLELIPRVGNHRIVIGDITDLEKKFNKLRIFYNKGLSKTGWNEYSVINLKYADQVVCTKR